MKKTLVVSLLALLAPAADCNASPATSFTDTRAQSTATITVAGNATTSAEVDLGGTEIVGLQLPAAFTGTTITFLISAVSGGTYQQMTDGAGATVGKTVAQGKYVGVDPTLFRGVRFVKLVSGSSEASDRQVIIFSIPAK